MPVPSGGPRPMNTLTGQQNQPQSAVAVMKNGAGRAIGKLNTLLTSVVSGNNVQSLQERTHLSEAVGGGRSSKRLKTTHNNLPGKFQQVDGIQSEIDDDDDDELSTGLVRVEIPRNMNGRVALSESLASSTTANRPGLSGRRYNLEDMMDSNSYARSRGPPAKMTSKLQPRGKETLSIDLTGNDLVPTQRYRGTARPSERTRDQVLKHNNDKTTLFGTQSKFFTHSAHSQNGSSSPYPSETLRQHSNDDSDPRARNLSKTFISMDGLRRHSQSGISSDELAATSPIEEYATVSRLSPPKQSRHPSQSPLAPEQQRGEALQLKSQGLESSNIKSTRFTDSVVSSEVAKQLSKKAKKSSAKDVEGFEASLIIVDGSIVESGQHGLGLVFDNAGEGLDVHFNGQNLSKLQAKFHMKLRRIISITWCPNCAILRLEFARGGDHPSEVDVRFLSEGKAARLVQSLAKKRKMFNVHEKDGLYMNKMFDRSVADGHIWTTTENGIVDDRVTELGLLTKKKQRRDRTSPESRDPEPGNVKRRRADDKIIVRQKGEKNSPDDLLAQGIPSQTSKRQETSYRMLSYSDDGPSASQRHTSIDRIMSDLESSNSQHVTRSKSSSGRVFNLPRGISPLAEEIPEELRFSKQYGLGTRWKKPLIFPKVGKKKTTVEYDDLERLDDGQFLNDNLLGFYLRFLEYHLEKQRPDVAKKVYWFNTYFFASLNQTVRGKRGINYEAVRKWTRNIDVFTYDYAVVPINESAHWYVAIICNLRALNRKPNIEGGDGPSSPRYENFEALDELESEPLEGTSAIPEDRESKETQKATDEIGKGSDNDATESFADLQLSEKEDTSRPEKLEDVRLRSRSSPQGLFRRNTELEPMHAPLAQIESQIPGADTDSIVVTEEPTGRTPVSQRKGKRKSIPPPRVFDPEQPAIITLDSLGIAHSPTIRVLKDYLREEANDKRGGMTFDDTQIKGITVKQIPLQDNFCDCGLFLLGYMEKFVEDPRDFVTKVLQRDFDPMKDWPNLNPTVMRVTIRDLVQELHSKQEDEREELKRPQVAKVIDKETKLEHETPASPTTKQTLPVTNRAIDHKLQKKGGGSEADDHGDPAPSTRRIALQSALLVDEPNTLPQRTAEKRKHNDTGPKLSKNTLSFISEKSPIVLDSQEDMAQEQPPNFLARISVDNEPVELPMEIPESPTRATTRGKPSPEPDFHETATVAKSKCERTGEIRGTKDRRQVISLSDS
ncbi:hypothetical protein MMC11_006958 [Xylographa trunciseda]|nr:hypothetical protein [Xylographa trunciseda]